MPHLLPNADTPAMVVPDMKATLLLLAGLAAATGSCSSGPAAATRLPEPTGKFAVGVFNYVFTDSSRPETFTPDTTDFREIAVRIWYPAEDPGPDAKPVPYVENPEARKRALPDRSPLPPRFFDSAGTWLTSSYRDAVPALESCPVVIFSHAYGAGMNQSTVLMEELASHGYVAVSVGHAYETSHFEYQDGTVRAFSPDNAELRLRAIERGKAMDAQAKLNQTEDSEELSALIRQMNDMRPATLRSLDIWVADIGSAIDRLEEMDREGMFLGMMDLGRIGVIGHSFGGVAAGQALLEDERCRAGVNLDGLQLGNMLDQPAGRPMMFVHHDNPGATNKFPNLVFFESATDTAYLVLVRGTRHLDFSDLCWPPFRRVMPFPEGTFGPIDGLRCLKVQNDLVREFFDRHLRGLEAPLLYDPSQDYPEIQLRMRAP